MVQNTEKRESCNLALVMVVVRGLAAVVVAGTYQERSGVPAQQQGVMDAHESFAWWSGAVLVEVVEMVLEVVPQGTVVLAAWQGLAPY